MGSPAQRTLYINFPDGITSVSVQGSMITFNITTSDLSYQMVKETAANLTGTIKNFEGPHVIVFQAINNYVNITDQ